MTQQKTIWYINKYASPPGSNGGLRGLSLTSEFIKEGHQALVVNSRSNHYIINTPLRGTRVAPGFLYEQYWGVPTYTHTTIQYTATASARRILSWLHFELGLLRLPLRAMPPPTHIIVSSLSLLTILNGYRLSRKFGARLLFEIRDIWPLSLVVESSLTHRNPLVRLLSWVEKFGYTKADAVVGTMPNLVEHVHSVCHDQIRVRTIGLGVDPELSEIAGLKTAVPRSQNFRVAYAGSIGRANALDKLLDVAAGFDANDGITFEFFGRGDFLDRYVNNYKNKTHIIFHGAIPRNALLREMASVDVVFLAAEDSEIWRYGQSLHKVVEYMALGRPIIASYSGFPSMINEAECGIFVPAGDTSALRAAILKLKAMTPQQREAMGARGRIWIFQNRTYAKLARDYLAIMDEL